MSFSSPPPVEPLTLAQVLRVGLPIHASKHPVPPHHWKTLRAIQACRTPALGGHLYRCDLCARDHFAPHSCRNRHCPTCQGANGADWLAKQEEALLPIPYFHLVFTLPHEFNPIIRQNRAPLYKLLFDTVSATLLEFAQTHLRARVGFTTVLHTWSQTLLDHYHVHCIVTGGGLRDDGSWRAVKPYWLFPVRALSVVFRGKFRDGLYALMPKLEFHGDIEALREPRSFQRLVRGACRKKWTVYAKRPFAGPKQVLAYLARYTHRVGLTNRRLLHLDHEQKTITFAYKDYADHATKKSMTLDLSEFLRRFRLHILPQRFVKIRHYGFLSNRNRQGHVAMARAALGTAPPPGESMTPVETTSAPPTSPSVMCPHCRQTALRFIRVVPPVRGSFQPFDDTS